MDSDVVKWLLGLVNMIIGFFLYTTRDKLKENQQEQAAQNQEINDIKSELLLMKNTTVTDKELTGYLTELKKDLNIELKQISQSMDSHRQESSARMQEMRDTVLRLAVLLEDKNNGNSK